MTSEAASYLFNPLGGEASLAGESSRTRVEAQAPQASLDGAANRGEIESRIQANVEEDSRFIIGLSDGVLLEQLCDGRNEAFAILFRRYARMVRTVAYRILRDASEAEDLLQEVFLFIFRKRALFDAARGSARSWIVQITYHRAIDRRRHLISRHFYASLELTNPAAEAFRTEVAFYERTLEGALGKAALERIDEILSEQQQRTLQLFFFEGYTIEEIAAETGESAGNIRHHYYRALEKIRKVLIPAKLRAK